MSIPAEAIEEAADIIWMRANGENGVCGTDRKTHSYAVATEVATAALTAASPAIQAAAIAAVSAYLERIHPSGLTPTRAVLADLAVVEHRMGRGLHANGNDRITP